MAKKSKIPPRALNPDSPPVNDWWTKPVEGWREGKITIRNMVTGKETVIDLKTGGWHEKE